MQDARLSGLEAEWRALDDAALANFWGGVAQEVAAQTEPPTLEHVKQETTWAVQLVHSGIEDLQWVAVQLVHSGIEDL